MTYSDTGWLTSRITALDVDRGEVLLRGWAVLIAAAERSLPIDDLDVVLTDADGEQRLRAAMTDDPSLDELAVARSGKQHARGFTARFERPALRELAETIGAKFSAAVRVRSGPHRLQHPLAHPEPGPVQRAHLVALDASRTLCFAWEDRGPLYAVVRRTRPIVSACQVRGDRIDLRL
jgi:hypothetical protein